MTKYVEVSVNVPPVSGVFHYHLPGNLEAEIQPGMLIQVTFNNRLVQGVVLRFVDQPEVEETLPVEEVLDPAVSLTPHQIALAQKMSEKYLAPLSSCVELMLPAGISQQSDNLYKLLSKPVQDLHLFTPTQNQIINQLNERGPLRGRQLDRVIKRKNWKEDARKLVKKGYISSKSMLLPPSVRSKYIRTAQLGISPELIGTLDINQLGNNENTRTRRMLALELLVREMSPVDVSWVYAESGSSLTDLKILHEKGYLILSEQEAWRDPLAGLSFDPAIPPELTPAQSSAWEQIKSGLKSPSNIKPFLLHGVTGSGKTELYLRAVEETLKQGKQALVLVPEISLTPQTIQRFLSRFPGKVGLTHSGLSGGERYDTWRRARKEQLQVIVGPRSALFTPLPNIGLIVLDESHDSSFNQGFRLPYYNGRDTAVEYAKLIGATCILGTATPASDSYWKASRGDYTLIELPDRIIAHRDTIKAYKKRFGKIKIYDSQNLQVSESNLPDVEIVDMREELKLGRRGLFSKSLKDALADVLANDQQAILFLNRRGTATYVFCRTCGHTMQCPRCDSNLTFHASANISKLICHHCGHKESMPKSCPECGSEQIRQYGVGTERVEKEVKQLFPDARTLRWDYDTTRTKGAHDIIVNHFTNHRADVLIGTQMLAKGLDLPLVTLVGVVLADVGLNMPDFRAGERVFQTLSQVAGRAGRSPLGGRVILQSFQPEHRVIQHTSKHDYKGFIEHELNLRKKIGYPPYSKFIRLLYNSQVPGKSEMEAKKMASQLRLWIRTEAQGAVDMVGPVPAFYTRLENRYRWQILLRGNDPAVFLRGKKLGDWRIEVDPQSLL